MNGDKTPPMRPIIEQLVSAAVRNDVGYSSDVIMYKKLKLAETPHLPRITTEMTSHSFSVNSYDVIGNTSRLFEVAGEGFTFWQD